MALWPEEESAKKPVRLKNINHWQYPASGKLNMRRVTSNVCLSGVIYKQKSICFASNYYVDNSSSNWQPQ